MYNDETIQIINYIPISLIFNKLTGKKIMIVICWIFFFIKKKNKKR